MALPKFSNYYSNQTGSIKSVLVEVSISGLGSAMAAVEEIYTGGFDATGEALYQEALLIMYAAKRTTPVRYGWLRGSGHVYEPKVSEREISVEMGFGGPAGVGNVGETNPEPVGYALPVHENLTAHHPVGTAKYLEGPFLAALAGLDTRIAYRVKRQLGL